MWVTDAIVKVNQVDTAHMMINASWMLESFEHIAGRAWPEGMPSHERVLLDALTPDQQTVAFRRLQAVMDAEEKAVPVGTAALSAGLRRRAFKDLRERWAATR